jgi:hypothetical protein
MFAGFMLTNKSSDNITTFYPPEALVEVDRSDCGQTFSALLLICGGLRTLSSISAARC